MSTTTNPNTNGTLVDTEMEASARIASVVVAVRPETRTDNTTENSENSMDFTTAPIPPDIHAEGYQTKMNAQNTNECQNESVDTKVSSVLDTVVAGADTSEQGQSAAAAVAPPLQQDQLPSDIASSKLEYPRPNDILMPVGGYQLWSGNAHYQELIETHRPEFLLLLKEVDDRDNGNNNERKQSIVRKIFQTIDKVQSGRFLMAVPVAAETLPLSGTGTSGSGGKIVRTMVWNVMKEEDVLAQVEQSLTTRSEEEARRHAKLERKRRRKEKRRKRRERRRQRRRDRKTVEASWERPISPSAMGALQSLYYVPPHYPLKDGKKRSGLECDSESLSSSSSSSSSSDEETIVRPAKKKKKVARKASKLPTLAPASTSLVLEQKESSTEPTSAKKEVNFHYKPKTKKSLQAVIDTEGEATLPKGVTVRPSGKWQAQTYFAGQSRYVGVYDTSRLASRAYSVVQDYLRSYRTIRGINKESAKEDLAQIFANARRAGDDAVKELVQEIRVQRHKEVLQSLAAPKPKPDPLAAAPPSAPTTAAPSAPAALAPSVSVIRDNNSRAHVPDLPQDSPPVDDSLAVLPELLSNLPPTEPLPNEAATLPVLPAPENVDQTKV